MKTKFFGKEIISYLLVSATFIPIAIIIKGLGLGYWFNIIATMILCIGVYGVFLLVTKDPLLEVVFGILKRKK